MDVAWQVRRRDLTEDRAVLSCKPSAHRCHPRARAVPLHEQEAEKL